MANVRILKVEFNLATVVFIYQKMMKRLAGKTEIISGGKWKS
jgi:hypothetical protein